MISIPTAPGSRIVFIDNIRVLLIVLIVLIHVAITYGGPGSWYYREVPLDDLDAAVGFLFGIYNMTANGFALGFFFLIAGYFTPGSYDHKGAREFLETRFSRLGIPLLFYVAVIDPVIKYTLQVTVSGGDPSIVQFLGSFLRNYRGLGVGPLWFVEILLVFTVLYVLWRKLTSGRPVSITWNLPGNAGMAGYALVVCVLTFIVRIWLPEGWRFELLNLQFPNFPQYICMFPLGIIAWRNHWFEQLTENRGALWSAVVVALLALCPVVLYLGGAVEDYTVFMGGFTWQSLFYAAWEQFICVGMVISLSVLFRRIFDHQGAFAQSLSRSAYTVYVIHAPVIIFLALALRNITLYPLFKFLLVAPIAVALCFLTANLVRKLPLARNVL